MIRLLLQLKIYNITNNKLITSTISQATTPELRFAQYFSELAHEKEGARALAYSLDPKNLEVYKPQLLEFIKKSPTNILMTIGKTLKCPVSVGRAEKVVHDHIESALTWQLRRPHRNQLLSPG